MNSTKNVSDISPLVESQSYARNRYHECKDELDALQVAIVEANDDIGDMYTMSDLVSNIGYGRIMRYEDMFNLVLCAVCIIGTAVLIYQSGVPA